MIVVFGGVFTLKRVPQGILGATAYFEGMTLDVLDGLVHNVCLVWVDDEFIREDTAGELARCVETVLKRLIT